MRAGGGGSGAPTLHEFFADAGVHLVFRRSAAGSRAVLIGPARERAGVERAPGAEYLGVRFRAGQAPRLAAIRSRDLTDRTLDLDRVAGVPIDALARRLAALPGPVERLRALEELVRAVPEPLVDDEACRRATHLLEARRGHARIDALAAEVGLHARTLERRFLAAFAMTPKRLARLVRLRHVLGALHAGGHATLADLALACGYADQPHLIRDFKALTGRVPGEPDVARSRLLARAEVRVVHRVRR